jgi:signal transduction histidine kinase
MGLGLSLARSIVTVHGGSISLAASTAGGATFIVTLPVRGALSLQHAHPMDDRSPTVH